MIAREFLIVENEQRYADTDVPPHPIGSIHAKLASPVGAGEAFAAHGAGLPTIAEVARLGGAETALCVANRVSRSQGKKAKR